MTASHNPGHGTKADIKDCESRLGATKSPRVPTLDGRPRRPILPFWQLWIQFGLSPRRVAWRSLKVKGIGVSNRLPVDCMWNGGSDLQAGVEIYHWGYLRFWLILANQNDPLLGPQFCSPLRSVGGPISLCLCRARTQFKVLHLDIGPTSCLLSCEPLALPWTSNPHVGMTSILMILAS